MNIDHYAHLLYFLTVTHFVNYTVAVQTFSQVDRFSQFESVVFSFLFFKFLAANFYIGKEVLSSFYFFSFICECIDFFYQSYF